MAVHRGSEAGHAEEGGVLLYTLNLSCNHHPMLCWCARALAARHLGGEAGPAEEGEALVQRGRQHARQDLVHRLQRVIQDTLGAGHQDLRAHRRNAISTTRVPNS